jgi:hypothetical protein
MTASHAADRAPPALANDPLSAFGPTRDADRVAAADQASRRGATERTLAAAGRLAEAA